MAPWALMRSQIQPGSRGEHIRCRLLPEAGSLLRAMPARDHLHEQVRHALLRDGWTITHDPLRLRWGKKDVYVDLGAERIVGARKGEVQIAVEIKSFAGPSPVDALEKALGQFTLYHDILARLEPHRVLYLAVTDATYDDVFQEGMGQLLLDNGRLKMLVLNPETEVIERWTPEPPTAK